MCLLLQGRWQIISHDEDQVRIHENEGRKQLLAAQRWRVRIWRREAQTTTKKTLRKFKISKKIKGKKKISGCKCEHGTSVVEMSNRRHVSVRYFYIVKYVSELWEVWVVEHSYHNHSCDRLPTLPKVLTRTTGMTQFLDVSEHKTIIPNISCPLRKTQFD